MHRKISLALAAILALSSLSACGKNINETAAESVPAIESESLAETTVVSEPETTLSEPEKTEVNYLIPSLIQEAYAPLTLTPNAQKYSVAADLGNIVNLDQFELSDSAKQMIAQNGFVVLPTDNEQLFYLYEENTYKVIPNFITTDSVLQLYHIFFDFVLRNVEQDYFYEESIELNNQMISSLLEQYNTCTNEYVKASLEKTIAYFAVSNQLLEQPSIEGLPASVNEIVAAELQNIEQETLLYSAIAGVDIDYSLFKVRGHYTRSEELSKYFRAFSWYGVMPLPLETGDNLYSAILMADTLVTNPKARKNWDDIYSVTSFLVGQSDDITPIEIAELVNEVYGEIPAPDRLPEEIITFQEKIQTLREPKIVTKKIDKDMEQKRQLRFMGQRYLADSDILQRLCDAEERPIPTGLDIFAVYGSEQAEKLLDAFYEPKAISSKYEEEFNKAAEEFRNKTVAENTSNIYNGWLYSLNEIATTKKEGYPFFMQNEAWMNKSLNTALASWSELRHDTILYGKQSGAECGGDCDFPEYVAYVEPDAEFFHRLKWLTETTCNGLTERGICPEKVSYKSATIISELEFLENCAVKELNGEDLTEDEIYSLLFYGGSLEYLSSSIADASDWYLVENETDRNMAVIADVHRAYSTYLEEGVGSANAIYVAVPYNGKVYLTRGAVFDYYEFTSDTRLTDEEWQKLLKDGNAPARTPYSNTFLIPEKEQELAVPEQPFSTGC